jgi:hypothetical protein
MEQLKTKQQRSPCPVCNRGFDPATDRQWAYRWNYHLQFSERHKKYERLRQDASQSASPRTGDAIIPAVHV